MTEEDLRKKARRRALRAARVVTLGLAIAGPGCGESHQLGADASATDGGPIVVDAAIRADAGPRVDLGRDLGQDLGRDLGPEEQDMGMCPTDPFVTPPETQECCEAIGGWWDEATGSCAVAVPGPFVPPSMTA